MAQTRKGFLFRFPRIAGILFIAFITMFSFDVFGQGYTFWETALALFMHNLPSIALTIILILSRKRYPLVGAIAFTGFAVRYTITTVVRFFTSTGEGGVRLYYMLTRPLIIALPALAVGLAFFANRRVARKK